MAGKAPQTRRVPATPVLPVLDVDNYIPFFIGVIANKLVNGGSRLYRRRFGIGFTDWRILVMLAVEPPVTATRICLVIGLDKAAVSRGLGELEARGLIRCTAETAGRRSRGYVLTPEGRTIHDRVLEADIERERRLIADLSPDERTRLLDMLRHLLARIPDVEAYGAEE